MGAETEKSLVEWPVCLKGRVRRDLRRGQKSSSSWKSLALACLERAGRDMLCAFQIMDFPAHFRPSSVLLAPKVKDKWELLHAMVEAASQSWEMSADLTAESHRCLVAREQSVSTGMEAGIAVPHAAVAGLPQMILGMAVIPEGLEFESLDGQPATVVVMILVPKSEKLAHLQTLTEVARRLSGRDFRQQLLQASSGEEVVALWCE